MTSQWLAARRQEALALIDKGGLSARIGLRFLAQHGHD
jgi:hypothetical protein